MNRFYVFLVGLLIGAASVAGLWFYENAMDHKERVPGVTEADIRQIPPGAVNYKSLGNRWLTFELEGKTYYMRRGWRADTPDVIFPASK